MRIAQVATLAAPVHQEARGSVEGLVWLLTRELIRLGHEVTVFAAGGSDACGEVVTTLPGPYNRDGSPGDWHLCEWINLCHAVEQSERFDVMHSHAYLWGLPMEAFAQASMVHTLHVRPHRDEAYLWSRVPNACVTAVSGDQWSAFPALRPSAVIHHGVDRSLFTLRPQPEDYVCFLGRFIPGKGPLEAIAIARALGLRLLLAGQRNDYYRSHVEPLVDGRSVEYVGYVSGVQKDRLLGGARALLYPIQEPEPFGLVLAEAMMCGTPVVAMRLGAAPEIVDEGRTGYCAESTEDLARQVSRAFALDRRCVRETAELRFGAERMARQYALVYEQVIGGHRP